MVSIGVQTKNVVFDSDPAAGFQMLRDAGFTCADFSLNSYLLNTSLYRFELNDFFDRSDTELEQYFSPHKNAKDSIVVQFVRLSQSAAGVQQKFK